MFAEEGFVDVGGGFVIHSEFLIGVVCYTASISYISAFVKGFYRYFLTFFKDFIASSRSRLNSPLLPFVCASWIRASIASEIIL